jgi:hypothetical protein
MLVRTCEADGDYAGGKLIFTGFSFNADEDGGLRSWKITFLFS